MTPEPNIENMSFKPFTVNEYFTINLYKPNKPIIFFESISSLDTKYFTESGTKTFVSNTDSESFAVLHLKKYEKKLRKFSRIL